MLILSEEVENRESILRDVCLATVLSGAGFSIEQFESVKLETEETIDVVLKKKYDSTQEYLILGIDSEEEAKSFSEHLDIFINGKKYYRIAVSEDANYDRFIYNFALQYLKLRPDHCISLYGDTFFFLRDMQRLESEGGYYKGWCYKKTE